MHQANPSILSVATATPPHRIPQPVAKDFARAMFSDVYRDIDRLLPIFDHSGVEHRNFCVPAEWFYEDHSFSEKNDLYVESALDLSEKAARRALDKAGGRPVGRRRRIFRLDHGPRHPLHRLVPPQEARPLGAHEAGSGRRARLRGRGLRARARGALRPGLPSGRTGPAGRGRALRPHVPEGRPLEG